MAAIQQQSAGRVKRSLFPGCPPAEGRASGAGRSDGKDGLPKGRLSCKSMDGEPRMDVVQARFDHRVFRIRRPVGTHRAHDRPAGPGAPLPLVPPRGVHAVGVVLEMDAGVANEQVRGGVLQDPGERGIRHGPGGEHGFVSRQFGPHGPVQAKEGPGGETARPQRLTVLEAAKIEGRAPLIVAMLVQRPPVEPLPGGRQMGTGGKRDHGACVGA